MLLLLMSVQDTKDNDFLIRVFHKYKRLILSIAHRYTDSPEDQEEVLQSVLVKMVQHVDTLRTLDDQKLTAYIGMTAKHTAINYSKHLSVLQKHNISLEDNLSCIDTEYFKSPENIVIMLENRAFLRQALSNLSQTDQTLLEGKIFLGLTDTELAGILGCKPRSITMMITRAKRRAICEIMRMKQDDES